MSGNEFAPRAIVVVHQPVWDLIERMAAENGMELVTLSIQTDPDIPTYIFRHKEN